MGDYTSSAQLIPQVIWALILSAHEFYQQVCMHNQLDLTAGTPCTARASLSTYTHMITLKLKLNLDRLPPQWATQPSVRHTITSDQYNTNGKQLPQKSNKPTTSNAQLNPSANTTASVRTNTQWPHIFTSNDTLKLLQAKRGQILTEIFSEAGIGGGGGDQLDRINIYDVSGSRLPMVY